MFHSFLSVLLFTTHAYIYSFLLLHFLPHLCISLLHIKVLLYPTPRIRRCVLPLFPCEVPLPTAKDTRVTVRGGGLLYESA